MSTNTSVNDTTDAATRELAAEQPDLAELVRLYSGAIMLGNGMIL